jgi:putative oxidoreductase
MTLEDGTSSEMRWQRLATLYARLALGSAFLSAVDSRFGLWKGHLGLDCFAGFIEYTAEVNSFMPAATIPFLARAATVAEVSLGAVLVAGLWPRVAPRASALLLAAFGSAMAISFGVKSPMDYSVFSASAAALLLALASLAASPHSSRVQPWAAA